MKKIIQYGARWCNPCRSMKIMIEKLVKKHDELVYEYRDITDEKYLSELDSRGISSIPFTIFENDGVKSSAVGLVSLEDMEVILGF